MRSCLLTSAYVSTGLDFLFEREETWCCPVHDFGRAKAKITLQPDYGRLVRWWQRCRAGDRRHCDSQERHAFGGGRFPICFGAGQDCELPDPGVADMGARYAPVMLALRLFLPESWASKRARLDRADGASRIWHGPNEAGDCFFGGDRSWWPSGGVPVSGTSTFYR